MTYTINAARYANADKTAAVLETAEAGAVAISKVDTPKEWAAMLAWGTPAAYVPPPTPPPPVTAGALLDVLSSAERTAIAGNFDLFRLAARGPDEIPATNAKLVRLASKAGITASAWVARVTS